MGKKMRLSALVLVFALLSSLFPAVAAVDTPMPPEWCPAGEYAVFTGSEVYEGENWASILRLRADAKAGSLSPDAFRSSSLAADWTRLDALSEQDAGAAFELGLLDLQYRYNGGVGRFTDWYFSKCLTLTPDGAASRLPAQLWYYRMIAPGNEQHLSKYFLSFFPKSGYTLAQYWNCKFMGVLPLERQQLILDKLKEKGTDIAGLSLHPTAPKPFTFETAGTQVLPTPPSWCREEEYLRCNQSVVYLPQNWARLQRVRSYLSAPNARAEDWDAAIYQDYRYLKSLHEEDAYRSDDGLQFELGMLMVRAYGLSGRWEAEPGMYGNAIGDYLSGPQFPEEGENAYAAWLWAGRACALGDTMDDWAQEVLMRYMAQLLPDSRFSMEKFLDCDLFRAMPAQSRQAMTDLTFVCLDGGIVHPGKYAKEWQICKAVNNRTMAPVRCLAEKLGAEVVWNGAEQSITLKRAGDTVVMTLGSMTATINGVSTTMDVAPIVIDQRTYLPARYVAEFFGQKVAWDQQRHTVWITEDTSTAGASNLAAWALPMGAALNDRNGMDVTIFGGWSRGETAQLSPGANFLAQDAQGSLTSNSWGMSGRDDLIATVLRMTEHGHNDSFRAAAAIVNGLTAEQLQELVAQSDKTEQYMWPYTLELSKKWGDRGILAWDLFRMSNLVQWGYAAGWITYAEALALLEPAAKRLQANFSSWDEAYENYLDGYCWWSRENVLGEDIWQTARGKAYQKMKETPAIAAIFNDYLFQSNIVPVPGISVSTLMQD